MGEAVYMCTYNSAPLFRKWPRVLYIHVVHVLMMVADSFSCVHTLSSVAVTCDPPSVPPFLSHFLLPSLPLGTAQSVRRTPRR